MNILKKTAKENIITNGNIYNDKSKGLLNINFAKNKDDENNMSNLSEISLNSDKTDCEDCKCLHKQRINITPLDKSDVYAILNDYFTEFNFKDENEFNRNFTNGEIFICKDSIKVLKPIKNHYMRRRVCMKLFKVFDKLVK